MDILVFTDLDGTLLDHETYDWSPAQSAMHRLKRHNIPLIINTSKTWSEVKALKEELDNHDPAITENGGCLYWPDNLTNNSHYKKQTLGPSYEAIQTCLNHLPLDIRQAISGFSDMSVGDVQKATGLDAEKAQKAKERDASEPFLWSGDENLYQNLITHLHDNHLNLVQGGRFYHIIGPSDKGQALTAISQRYKQEHGNPLLTIALGDGPNDIAMLERADYAVVIPNPKGKTIAPHKNPEHLLTAEQAGPFGWNQSLHKLLNLLQVPE